MTTVKLNTLGTGAHLPERRVASAELEHELGLAEGYYERHVGVRHRHRAAAGETGSQLGAAATRAALDAAGLSAADLDVIVGASATTDYLLPSRAAALAAELYRDSEAPRGLNCIDVGATCLSFVSGLHYAGLLLQQRPGLRIAVVSAEIAQYGLTPSRVEAYGLFGDGAAAAVVTGVNAPERDDAVGAGTIEHYATATYPAGFEHCIIRAGGNAVPTANTPYTPELYGFEMDGCPLLRLMQAALPDFLDDFARGAGHADAAALLDTIDLVIPHQTSAMGFRLLRGVIGEAPAVDCLADYGNCIAASIPLALHHAVVTGRLRRGQRAILLGSAAGLTLGALVLRY